MPRGWLRDPRSPTRDFQRTPIIDVERLIRLPDPRSPTPGIPRTPIMVVKRRDLTECTEKDKKANGQKPSNEEVWVISGAVQRGVVSYCKHKERKPLRRKLFTSPDQN